MVINKKKYLLLAIILFVFTSFLSAQNAGYFIEEKGDEIKYIQRFVWTGGEYALHYEVIFEREINGTYSQYLRETTKAQFIEVSLPPGPYRFRVIPYDILGRPTEGSQWVNIVVLPIPKPEQYEEQKPESKTALKTEAEPKSEEEKEEEPEKPEKEKTVFFRLGAELGAGRHSLYGNQFFGGSGSGVIGLRTSLVFKTPLDVYLGTELTGGVNENGHIEDWKMNYFIFGLNILAEKWSPRKIFGVGFRIGVLYPSIDIQKNWHEMTREQQEYFKRDADDMNYIVWEDGFNVERLIPNIGVSLFWLIKKHLFVELGFNYVHLFPMYKSYPASGFFCPMLGISYQF